MQSAHAFPSLDGKTTESLWKEGLELRRPQSRLVVPDMKARIPVLYPASSDGDNTHQRDYHSDYWFRVFNPSVGDAKDCTILKLGTWGYCQVGSQQPVRHDGTNESFSMGLENEGRPREFGPGLGNPHKPAHYQIYSAFMRGGRLQRMYLDTADARIFSKAGRPYGIFSRIDPSTYFVQPYLLNLDASESAHEDGLDEVLLRWRHASSGHQRNWSPLPVRGSSQDRVYVTYSICPHVVLDCSMTSGDCEKAYESRNTEVCGKPGDDATSSSLALRGSSLPVDLSGVVGLSRLLGGDFLLSVAHTVEDANSHKFALRTYLHRFVLYDAKPPFAVRDVSAAFTFPSFFGDSETDNEMDGIQYCSGMALKGHDLTLSYGVGDCVAMQVQVPLNAVFSALH